MAIRKETAKVYRQKELGYFRVLVVITLAVHVHPINPPTDRTHWSCRCKDGTCSIDIAIYNIYACSQWVQLEGGTSGCGQCTGG